MVLCRSLISLHQRLLGGGVRRLLFSMPPTREVVWDGIRVLDFLDDEGSHQRTETVCEALQIIATVDPLWLSRIKRDMPTIAITHMRSRAAGAYIFRLHACTINPQFLQHHAVNTALTLVHEATHAYIDQHNVIQWHGRSTRFERLCRREQIRFAKKLVLTGYSGMSEYVQREHQRFLGDSRKYGWKSSSI